MRKCLSLRATKLICHPERSAAQSKDLRLFFNPSFGSSREVCTCRNGNQVKMRAARFEKRARISDGPELIAAEEARSRAGGQHAQMPPRADAPLTQPRPAPCSWCKQSLNGKNVHGEPRWLEHSPTSASVYSRTAPAARAIAFESCSRPKSLRQPQKLDGRRPCNRA